MEAVQPVPIISKSLSIDTALGILTFVVSIEGNDVSSENIILKTFPIKPNLPTGMNVRNCNAILIQLSKSNKPFGLTYSAVLESNLNGTTCTGEHLDAIEWEDSQSILVVGTEDGEALKSRMPWWNNDTIESSASYETSFLRINHAKALHPKEISVHFIIAENPTPEPEECSSWFAVDCEHSKIVAYAKST